MENQIEYSVNIGKQCLRKGENNTKNSVKKSFFPVLLLCTEMQIVSAWAEGQEIAPDALRIPSVGVQAVADCLVCVNMGQDKQSF